MRCRTARTAAVAALCALLAGCVSTISGQAHYTYWGRNAWQGITIEVTSGQACAPGPNVHPRARLGALITIMVTNGRSYDYRLRDMTFSRPERAPDADRLLADPGGPCDAPLLPDRMIPPNQQFTFTIAFTVADVSAGKVTLALAPDFKAEPALFTGIVPAGDRA